MSIIYKIITVALVTAFLNSVLKKSHREYQVAISITASIIIFYFIADSFTAVFDSIKKMMSDTNIELSYVTSILKIIGIAYLSEYTGAILEDAGETAVAKKVEMAGKVLIFLITLPVLEALISLILTLI